uniref:Uncharacterized protein n=1 Tax=Arundo donax TaxID=35708 RepID=A0A0A9F0M9_ARUDO
MRGVYLTSPYAETIVLARYGTFTSLSFVVQSNEEM